MKMQSSNKNKHYVQWAIGGILLFIALAWGVAGYYALYSPKTGGAELWLNVIYKTFSSFYGGGSVEDSGFTLALARVAAILFTSWAVIFSAMLVMKQHMHQWWVIGKSRDHYVICGLGERGFALAENLLSQDDRKEVIAIESDFNNPNIERLRRLGGAVIEGNARDKHALLSAGLAHASHLITLTESDATNLEILDVATEVAKALPNKCSSGTAKNKFTCHVHIGNRENQVLFDVGGRFFPPTIRSEFSVEIALFNIYEHAAQMHFQKHLLGGVNTEIDKLDAEPVRLLINGLGRMGEAVLIEAMQMGHFANHKPIEITVLDDDATSREHKFFQRYWEIQNHLVGKPDGLGLWQLKFVASHDEVGPLNSYTDIFACHDAEDEALTAIHNLFERSLSADIKRRNTRFFVYIPSGRKLTNEKDITPIGSLKDVCCKGLVIDAELEKVSSQTHRIYSQKKLEELAKTDIVKGILNELQNKVITIDEALIKYDASQANPKNKLAWESLPLIKKASNRAEKRHIGIKLRALGLKEVKSSKDTNPFPLADSVDSDVSNEQWPMPEAYETNGILDFQKIYYLLAHAQQASRLTHEDIKKLIEALAETEHARWNAFHILNNYHYEQDVKASLRAHDCLLNWENLKNKMPKVLVYDYKNIYQIADVLSDVGYNIEPIEPLSK